jgi:hypothetical protein
MKVEWKFIPGYSNYAISNYGEVYSHITKRYLGLHESDNGYLRVNVVGDNGVKKSEFVHKLVLLTFVGPRPKGMITRHYPDQNRKNNRLDNLSYCDQQQNNWDRIENGTYNQASLTTEQVIHIKQMIKEKFTHKQIQEYYDISPAVISNIRHNNIWQNIGPDLSKMEHRRGGGQKLTIDDVIDIKICLQEDSHTCSELADRYGVDVTTIYKIRSGKHYADIKV